MSTPHDPHDAQDPRDHDDHEAAWRSIVDNYGARAELDDLPEADLPVPPARTDDDDVVVPPSLRDLDGPRSEPEPAEEHFVPPPPPPLPRATPPRLLAWIGLFGVPILVLVALVTRLPVPGWLGLLLMLWFVGGFVFLVASMRPGPHDHDDGAVL